MVKSAKWLLVPRKSFLPRNFYPCKALLSELYDVVLAYIGGFHGFLVRLHLTAQIFRCFSSFSAASIYPPITCGDGEMRGD